MKDYILNFDGYWRECNKNGLPTYPGIYLVYRSRYNPQNDTVSLVEIIYTLIPQHYNLTLFISS